MLPGAKALDDGPRLIALATLLLLLAAGGASTPESEATKIRALLAQNRWRDALARSRDLARQTPEDPEAISALGEALYRAGLLEEAESVLAPLVVPETPPARALLTLGLLRKAEGREEEAESLVERAVRAGPRDAWLAFWAADAAATNARAVELLEAYLSLSEGDDPDRTLGARDSVAFFRALGDRRVWVPVATPERLEIPLYPVGAGGRVRGYVLEALLGEGKPVRLLLDTGSTGLFLVERVAKHGSFVPLAMQTTFGGGGDQRHRTRRGILPAFALGGLKFKDALVTTTTGELEPTGRYQGVLGLQFLQGYRVTLALDRNRLLLEPPGDGKTGEPYWQVAGQFLVRAAAKDGTGGLFVLDTGAALTVLSLEYARGITGARVGAAATVRGFGGRLDSARSVRGVRLGFQGAETTSDVLAAADLGVQSRLGGVEVSGFLGLDVLQTKRVVIDTRARRVQVVPNPPR